MRLVGTVRLFVQNALWRATGWATAGRALLRTLGSDDEDLRSLAGMFLVQAGPRAEPLLREALRRRESLTLVLTILGDIGDRRVEPDLLPFARDDDPKVAEAAREALRLLNAH
jgi:HEAT repeat protein